MGYAKRAREREEMLMSAGYLKMKYLTHDGENVTLVHREGRILDWQPGANVIQVVWEPNKIFETAMKGEETVKIEFPDVVSADIYRIDNLVEFKFTADKAMMEMEQNRIRAYSEAGVVLPETQ